MAHKFTKRVLKKLLGLELTLEGLKRPPKTDASLGAVVDSLA